jgi:very-short-patch-repair endonuclease
MKKEHKFLPYDTELTTKARENRRNQTFPEKMMWLGLFRDRGFEGFKFIRQKPIDRFIIDFYCAELMLAVEVDGDTHSLQQEYDGERTKILNALGITVIRYSDDEVLENLDGVHADLKRKVDKLREKLKDRPPVAPLSRGAKKFVSPLIRACPAQREGIKGG